MINLFKKGYDMETEVKVKKYTCERCGHSWISRIATIPKRCPKCKSPNWAIPRKENKKELRVKNLFLKELILRRGYRQYEVANMVGMHPTLLSDYIIGARDISDERKEKLAEVLGVAKEDITKGEFI